MTDYLKVGVGWPWARQNRGKVEPTRRPCVRERSESASLGVESPTGSGGGGGGRGCSAGLFMKLERREEPGGAGQRGAAQYYAAPRSL